MFFSEPNSWSRFFAATGPIPGKPSRINCFCCSSGSLDLVCLRLNSGDSFSCRLARSIRNFAVSSSSSV